MAVAAVMLQSQQIPFAKAWADETPRGAGDGRYPAFVTQDDRRRDTASGASSPSISTTNTGQQQKPKRTPPAFRTSVSAVKGGRPYMEDDYVVGGGGRFVGVFDGHGGAKVSLYLRQNLYPFLQTLLPPPSSAAAGSDEGGGEEDRLSNIVDALKKSFDKIDRDVQAIRHWSYQGSTAVAVYLLNDPITSKLR